MFVNIFTRLLLQSIGYCGLSCIKKFPRLYSRWFLIFSVYSNQEAPTQPLILTQDEKCVSPFGPLSAPLPIGFSSDTWLREQRLLLLSAETIPDPDMCYRGFTQV